MYFDGHASPNIPFAGVVPGYPAGLYQINAQIPAGVSNGDDYIDILTPDAEAEQVTVTIARLSSAAWPHRAAGNAAVQGRGDTPDPSGRPKDGRRADDKVRKRKG